MSSMRNAVQRRNHKERGQPAERGKWGLLEKHKDYSLRAKDYNSKKSRLKSLRSKAAERNPDEFHHSMLSNRSAKGRKVGDRGNPRLSHDTIKLLKTQDAGYLRVMGQKTRRQRRRLEEEAPLDLYQSDLVDPTDDASKRAHKLVFKTDHAVAPSQRHMDQDVPTLSFDSPSEPLAWDADRHESRVSSGRDSRRDTELRHMLKRRRRDQTSRRSKLEVLRQRQSALETAEGELERQRAQMNNTIGGTNKAGLKFRIRERKR